MSLQIWYPFTTESLSPSNKGLLDDLTWTTDPSYSTDGKLGYCATNGACKMTAEQTAKALNNEEFSFCCWIYINKSEGTNANYFLFGNGENSFSENNKKFALFTNPTINDFSWAWQNGEFETFTSGTVTGAFPSYTWTHLAVTYKNPNGTIYINGLKVSEFTGISNSASFEYETEVLSLTDGSIYFNDYRVYNNCISAKEVKELSKGLVIHNPFSGVGADNLLYNSYTCTNWANNGFVSSIDPEDGSAVMSGLRNGCDNDQYPYTFTAGRIERSQALEFGGITISFDFRHNRILSDDEQELDNTKILMVVAVVSDGTQINWIYPTLNLGLFDGEWRRVSVSLTNSDLLVSGIGNYTADDIVGFDIKIRLAKNGMFHVKKLKVEKGFKSTPWVPNSSDSEYSRMGFDYHSAGFRDVSGNSLYIGVAGVPTELVNDAPRHETAIKFGYSNRDSAVANGPGIYASKWNYTYTVVVWLKYVDIRNISLFTIGNLELKTDANYFYINDIQYASVSQFNDCGWHMYSIVSSDSEDSAPLLFIDDIQFSATNTESLGSDLRMPLLLSDWDSASLNIKNQYSAAMSANRTYLSDFKLYSTILDPDDVKALYNSPISITKDGKLIACDFKEG